MNRILRNSLIGAGAVVVLVAAAPFVIPVDTYRGRIETAAAGATGRAFKIDGPLRLTIFPRFGVRAKDVTLANVPGGRARAMVAVGDINLSVKVLPLLTGRIALDKIVLDKPVIALEVDGAGNPNWKFGKSTATEAGATKKGSLTLPAGTEFSGIKIADGRITYNNAKTGTHRALDHVNVTIDITTADKPITAQGDMTYAAKKLSFVAHLATLQTFLGAGTTEFDLQADADLVHASVRGRLTPDGATDGAIRLDSPSFRNLAAWFGNKLPAGGLNGLALEAKIHNKDKITALEDLKVTLDGQTIKGRLVIDSWRTVPVLTGALDVDRLDVNPYLAGGPHEPDAAKQTGWSRKPINLAMLKEFNGTLALTTGSLKARGLKLGRTALKLDNRDGLMTVIIDRVSLYGGNGSANLVIDARGAVPQFANTMAFTGVALKPLLTDALGLDTIEGTGALKLDIRLAGASPYAMFHSLSGKGSITGTNGRFKGVDLGVVAKTVQTVLGGNATGEVAATTFHDMGASFTLGGGVLRTEDFHLSGPLVQMTGRGAVDIGERQIAFRIRPQAGYGGYGIAVPFLISGSWDKLHYAPDIAGVVDGLFGSLLGSRGATDSDKRGQKGQKKDLGDQLKNMFGIH